jgi:Spy/CpxP family protein refolding chaperone
MHDADRPMHAWLDGDDDRPLRRLFMQLTSDLDRDDRAAFREAIEAQRQPLTETGMALLEQRRIVLDLLRAEPFDRVALDAALAELGRRQDEFRKRLMSTIADAAAALPPEARAKLGGGWE